MHNTSQHQLYVCVYYNALTGTGAVHHFHITTSETSIIQYLWQNKKWLTNMQLPAWKIPSYNI
jgi:hypothetical protein